MIRKVTNLNKKSFQNYTGPDSDFNLKNIVFGYNGKGKSSMAEGIIEEYKRREGSGIEGFRFFNRRYVKDNLILENTNNSKIKGVIANFGKVNLDIEEKIRKLEDLIVDEEPVLNKIRTLTMRTREDIDNIHNRRKGSLNIKRKEINIPVHEVIKLYKKDLEEAKKIESSEEELLKIVGDNSLTSKMEAIDAFPLNNIREVEIDAVKLSAILLNPYNNVVPDFEVIQWINSGVKLHKEGDDCIFCGGTVDLSKIQSLVETYNVNEKQKDSIILQSTLTTLNQLRQELEKLLSLRDIYFSNIDANEKTKDLFEKLNGHLTQLAGFSKEIQEKISQMEIKLVLKPTQFNKTLKNIYDTFSAIQRIKSDKVKEIQTKINNETTLVKGAIGLEILNSNSITSTIGIIRSSEKGLEDIKAKNRQYKTEIEDLRKSKSLTKDFADHLNAILSDIGSSLKLDIREDYYVIQPVNSQNDLSVDDISEGEQNLLALLFFYYELFDYSKQNSLKDTVELIVMDDPISSIDDVNRIYVLELIKNLLEQENVQVFVFTHVWEDFCNLLYGKESKPDFTFFEIKKTDNVSNIIKIRSAEAPYNHHFKEIDEFAKKDESEIGSDCEIYHYPNVMRKVLEEFLSFKTKKSSPTKNNEANIARILFDGAQISNANKTKLGLLLDTCNILSHTAARHPNAIHQSADFLMKRIKAVDINHYSSIIDH